MKWIKFDVVDWLTSMAVLRMTDAQRGVYIQLLAMSAHDREALAGEPEQLMGLFRGSSVEDVAGVLRSCFVQGADGVWVNQRLEISRQEASERYDAKVAAGQKGAQARWSKPKKPKQEPAKDKRTPRKAKPWQKMLQQVPEEAREAFQAFAEARDEMKKPMTAASIKSHLKRPVRQLVAAYRQSVEKGWQGVFFENFTEDGQPVGASPSRSSKQQESIADFWAAEADDPDRIRNFHKRSNQ